MQIKRQASAAVNNVRVKGEGGVMGKVVDQSTMNIKGPKILYCSRTHSQIRQVASEMHKTDYRGAKCAYLRHV